MKSRFAILFVVGFSCVSSRANGQGILNGGFELYNPDTQFLVGWHARGGAGKDYGAEVEGVSGSLIPYGGGADPGLLAHILGPEAGNDGIPIGNYWFFGRGPATTIEQQLPVPSDTHSLQYRALAGYLGGVSVQVDGAVLTPELKKIIVPGGFFGLVADWAVDMTPYAGKQVNLTFYIGQSNAGIDDIRVSAEPVPEPGVLAFGALGLLTLLVGRGKAPARTLWNSLSEIQNHTSDRVANGGHVAVASGPPRG